MRRYRFWHHCTLPLMLLYVVAPAAAVIEEGSADKVRFLIAQIAQNQSRIISLTFKCSEEYRTHHPGGKVVFKRDWEVAQRGDHRAALRVSVMSGARGDQRAVTRAVLNDHYVARTQDARGYQFLHESIKSAPQRNQTEIAQYNQLDLLTFGFGDSRYRFTEWQFATGAFRWRVESEGPIYKVIGTDSATGERQRVWVIDSSKSFFIVAVHDYEKGKLLTQLTVQPVKIDDVWLAASAEQKTYAIGMSPANLESHGLESEQSVWRHTKWTFTDHKLNPEIADETFTTAFLELPNGTTVYQRQLDGTDVPMMYVNGEVVPRTDGPVSPIRAWNNALRGVSRQPVSNSQSVWIAAMAAAVLLIAAGAVVLFRRRAQS